MNQNGALAFGMSCQDFRGNFFCLFICNQVPVSLDHGNTLPESWSQLMFKNHLIPGNAEGSYDIGPQRDMQYIFSARKHGKQQCHHVLQFCHATKFKGKRQDISTEVRGAQEGVSHHHHVSSSSSISERERLPPTFFSKFTIAEKGIVSETTRNLTECFSLSPGTYVVVVSAGREAVEFLLRIFLKMPDSDRNLDDNLNLRPLQTGSLLPQKFDVGYSSLDPGKLSRNGSQRSIFYKYAQQGLDIDDTQVQRLLNQEFLKGPPGDTFSLDEFRSMVALTDVSFASVFQNFRKNSGVFPSPDLWKAIKDTDFLAGISVTSERLDVMRLRYSDGTGKVSFPSLVCVLMQLEAVTKAFQNLSEDGKGLYLTEMEVRYLPLPETGHNPRLPLLT
ncbi:hypothetical protein E2I00_020118 [Balaenoptera physalus]|uniref:Calpain-3/13-like C-terminal EF-hand domain-containing protein n=1 Tax=Balaenoptera physalus TaxID=9770 RepID=A0A643C8A6_BALPH|nr:hypothetical protein E2I00_020118 [Balaenoptera physalus]